MEKRSSRIKRSIKRKRIVWISTAAVLLLSDSLAYAGFNSGEEPSTPPSADAEKSVGDVKEEPTVEELAKATDEELVNQIHYYNEISLSKEEIQRNHPIATKIVNQKAKQQNVKPDLDNPRYRELAMEAGLELEGKTPEEQKDRADFAKKADQYENKELNKRIKELENKAKKEGLTEQERAELISLLPIKNPGPKLKPEPKKEAEKKPSAPSEEPVKTPGKEEQDDKQQDGVADGQPNPKEGDKQDGKPKDGIKDEPQGGKNREKTSKKIATRIRPVTTSKMAPAGMSLGTKVSGMTAATGIRTKSDGTETDRTTTMTAETAMRTDRTGIPNGPNPNSRR